MTDLGCSFLTEKCTNKSIYPYLCNVSAYPVTCTSDHLSKVRKYIQIVAKHICTHMYIRAFVQLIGHILMSVLLLKQLTQNLIADLS